MGLWHELVCSECNDSYIGVSTFKQARVKTMISLAESNGWVIDKKSNLVLCPQCVAKGN